MACSEAAYMFARYGARYPVSDAAAEGTAAHEVPEALVLGKPVPTVAQNGVPIDDDMMLHGMEFAAFVQSLGGEALAELPLELDVDGHIISGRSDLAVIVMIGDTLHVVDYKYGHRHVEPDSPQLKIYGLAANSVFGAANLVLHIHQPRDYTAEPFRRYEFTTEQQLRFLLDLRKAVVAIRERSGAVPGSHCMDCPGSAMCGALREAGLQAVDRAVPVTGEPLGPQALAFEYQLAQRASDIATARAKGLEQEVAHAIAEGAVVPGLALDRPLGRERWIDSAMALTTAKAFGIDIQKPAELVTPNQAIKAGIPAEIVRNLTERKPGEARVVPSTKTAAFQAFFKEK